MKITICDKEKTIIVESETSGTADILKILAEAQNSFLGRKTYEQGKLDARLEDELNIHIEDSGNPAGPKHV